MKRSDFVRRAMRPGTTVQVISEELASVQADLAEEAMRELLSRIARTDVAQIWGPELPKRLRAGTVLVDGHIEMPCLYDEIQSTGRESLSPEAIREAAARYNAVERFIEGHDRPIFERILAEERERLPCRS